MDYGAVLKRTWEITWKYKGLWVLGILAACGRGNGGGGGGGGQASSSVRGDLGSAGINGLTQFFNSIPEGTLIIGAVVIVALLLVLALIFLVLGVIGQGGLIAGFNQADEGADVNLAEAFGMGMHFFWRILALRLLLVIAGFIVAVGCIILIILTFGLGIFCMLCIGIPLLIAVGVYVEMTTVAIVVEDLDPFKALARAWDVIRNNIGPMLVMAVILVLGSLIVGLVFASPFILVVVPVVTALALGTRTAIGTGLLVGGLCLVAYIPILIVLNGILTTYVMGAWTLTFRRLTDRPGSVPQVIPAEPSPAPSN
jgi:hypothetical protein